MPAAQSTILYDTADGVATITLNRPEKLNAISDPMRAELLKAVQRSDTDPDIRVIVITGAGRAFCTGGDIEYLRELKGRNDEKNFIRLLDEGSRVVSALRRSGKPTIAMINGPAFGGGLIIATACDLRYCAESASFAMPFIKIGLGPDWGGTYLLSHLVGSAMALEMFYTGRSLTAVEAQAVGLVNAVIADDKLAGLTATIAQRLATRPPDILARYKRTVYHSLASSIDDAASLERQYQLENFRSDTLAEGIETFLNRKS